MASVKTEFDQVNDLAKANKMKNTLISVQHILMMLFLAVTISMIVMDYTSLQLDDTSKTSAMGLAGKTLVCLILLVLFYVLRSYVHKKYDQMLSMSIVTPEERALLEAERKQVNDNESSLVVWLFLFLTCTLVLTSMVVTSLSRRDYNKKFFGTAMVLFIAFILYVAYHFGSKTMLSFSGFTDMINARKARYSTKCVTQVVPVSPLPFDIPNNEQVPVAAPAPIIQEAPSAPVNTLSSAENLLESKLSSFLGSLPSLPTIGSEHFETMYNDSNNMATHY
jgi:cytochrome bd-type quinol oxidase subunit 2